VRGLEGLLRIRGATVLAAATELIDAFYAPLSPWVRHRLHLVGGGEQASVDVLVDGSELAESVALEFLVRGVPDAGRAEQLVETTAAGLKAADDWAEGCAERRAELARRRRVLDQARAGIQRLLAGGKAEGGGDAATVVVDSDSESGSASKTPSPPPEPATRKPRRG
jgi:hypothetical protein